MLLLLSSLAIGAPIELMVTLGGAAGPPSLGGTGSGRIAWNATDRWALEVGMREGVVTDDLRQLGVVLAGARWRAASGASVRVLFAHHHETPWALVKEHPVQATLGSLSGIRHRTGAEVGFGWDFPILPEELELPLGFFVSGSVAAFPDPHGPPVYAHLELGLRVGVGGD